MTNNELVLENFINFCDEMMIAEEGLKDGAKVVLESIRTAFRKLKQIIMSLINKLRSADAIIVSKDQSVLIEKIIHEANTLLKDTIEINNNLCRSYALSNNCSYEGKLADFSSINKMVDELLSNNTTNVLVGINYSAESIRITLSNTSILIDDYLKRIAEYINNGCSENNPYVCNMKNGVEYNKIIVKVYTWLLSHTRSK